MNNSKVERQEIDLYTATRALLGYPTIAIMGLEERSGLHGAARCAFPCGFDAAGMLSEVEFSYLVVRVVAVFELRWLEEVQDHFLVTFCN